MPCVELLAGKLDAVTHGNHTAGEPQKWMAGYLVNDVSPGDALTICHDYQAYREWLELTTANWSLRANTMSSWAASCNGGRAWWGCNSHGGMRCAPPALRVL